jgi:hypothetical protein
MNIDSKINSQEYKCKISEHLTTLLLRTKSAKNESETAFAFESEIYYLVRNFFGLDLNFSKEVGKTSLRHKFKGRMDALCNNLVIEYKNQGKLDFDNDKASATEQISNYMLQLRGDENAEYYGVLTDGIKIRYIYFLDGELHSTSFKNLDESDLDKVVRSLVDVNNKKFLPKNIVSDFSLEASTKVTYDLARYLFQKLHSNCTGKTSMLFQEWEVLFHLSENDKGQNEDIKKRRSALSKIFDIDINDATTDYKALFALQTTYAIIIKLIACKVVTKIEFNKNIDYFSDLTSIDSDVLRQFIEYLEDGYVFQTGGIRNLLEGDFFSWYCSEDVWSKEEASILIRIINILEGYTNSMYVHGYGTKDIFIDLYMEIMPPEVRHSLGEYFTPSWLADYVVDQSLSFLEDKNKYTAMDPCCGSGVFIVSLIKKIIGGSDIIALSNDEKRALLSSIVTRIKGVDINPLSVLTAKVTFYLAIKPLINQDDVEIPIYLGDSANIPEKILSNGVPCYKYSVNTKQDIINVLLPCAFVESENFFYSMSQIQAIVKVGDADLLFHKFISSFGKIEINDQVRIEIRSLSEQLIRLHENKWDGIWVRIVANFMLVGRIRDIDLIVGNPPWVKWEFLPQTYAEKIKSLCIDRHLFSGQTYMGAISLNICALIANVTASSWLSKNGILAFLMPQTLMSQDSYAGFRNFYLNKEKNERMYLRHLDDWTKSGNPFIDTQEKFMTYYYSKKVVDYLNDGIPITTISKVKGISINEINDKQSFSEVEGSFSISRNSRAYQMDPDRTGYTTLDESISGSKSKFKSIVGKCDYKARSGVEFTPAEVYFIEPQRGAFDSGSYVFKPSQFKSSKYKNTESLPKQFETKYVRPVIKAPNIIPFGFEDNNAYCIFPYDEGISTSVDTQKMSSESPNLLAYLISNKHQIGKQSKRSLTISRGTSFYSLSKVGPYTFSPFKVTFRDNTLLSAAVVKDVATPWDEIAQPVCAKHCPYISQDKDGRDITEEEAYYLCGILNAPVVREYFKATYSTRSYSINFNIKMPIYDVHNKFQRIIMKLAKRATNRGVSDQIFNLLEISYLRLCSDLN